MSEEQDKIDTQFWYVLIVFFLTLLVTVVLTYQRFFIAKDFTIEQDTADILVDY